jgi:broad specificity phosphatase PhoE
MKFCLSFIVLLFLNSCRTTNYYIIRHAEKETANTMTNDVPLSEAGRARAEVLKEYMKDKNIQYLYATNYSRTIETVEPTRQFYNGTIRLYNTRDTMDRFINNLKKLDGGNVLIVGHSNTVDDIANNLVGKKVINGDLPDSAYGDLFIVIKKGSHYAFRKSHFGKKS